MGDEKKMRAARGAWIAVACAATVGAAYQLGAFAPVLGCIRADAWPRDLIALHVVADGLVFAAYVWIPLVLIWIYTKLKARPAAELLYLFGAFIVLCGWTHLDSIITTWAPAYWYSGGVKMLTGIVSIATAIRLTKLSPQLLALGTMAADLQAAKEDADRLRREAEARATRAEGEVTELEQAQQKLKESLAREEKKTAEAERMRRDAMESASIAEAARRQAEAANEEKRAIQHAIKGLTTPILPLTDDIVVMPLVGELDSIRAAQVMDAATEYISTNQTRVLILDLSGVSVVDTQVASALIGTIQAVGLIGGECVVTGIQPAVAQTMVQLGIDMKASTRSTLRAGFRAAVGMVKA